MSNTKFNVKKITSQAKINKCIKNYPRGSVSCPKIFLSA